MANSSPVVLASDQSAIPVTASAGTNLNTSALALETGGNLASIKTNTDKIPALGQALAADSVPVVLTAAQLTTLTPVSTVTANAGTNLNTSALALETGGNLASVKTNTDALGAKTDNKSTATDTTSVSAISLLKEISYMEQNPAPRAVTNAGIFAVQSTNQANSGVDIGDVTINNAAGASAVNIQDGGNTITVDGTVSITANSAVNVAQVGGNAAASTGVNGSLAIGGPTAADAAIAVNPTTVGGRASSATPTAMSADGDVVNAWFTREGAQAVVPVPTATAPSITSPHKTDALVASATAVKASSGRIYGYHIYNPNATDMFFQLYNISAASVTVGTSTRYKTLCVPAHGVLDTSLVVPWGFDTAIAIAATTTVTGNTAPGTGLLVNIDYI